MPMKTGDIIWSAHETQGTWWYVWGDPLTTARAFDNNSVLVWGELPSGFEEWGYTSWDDETIRDQGARIVPEEEVPDEVWARIALWRLT